MTRRAPPDWGRDSNCDRINHSTSRHCKLLFMIVIIALFNFQLDFLIISIFIIEVLLL